ncbi:hypothetical protein MN116_007740 [Schistosoma mekongi]|uniref:Uncharacterized protein n=1 Tax=Schistosoma mekongi TaxID=38744 RepID=A0AAE1Z836_SCHME|nr:hypothetical protein MN116_007740 [Schistosoma mekongi]
MGAAFTKVLNYLHIVDHGEATSDSNLKKAKMTCILSSTQKPTKPNPYWKHLELKNVKEELRLGNLKAAARFIHECRCSRENLAVVTEPNNHESAVFIVVYFTILSGLPVKIARKAVTRSREKLDITDEYDSLIESMQKSVSAKELREELFRGTSGYTEDRLIEDLRKIYQLAELDPPTSSEIQLETRRDSIKPESTTQKPLNQMFRRLSVDKTKHETTDKENDGNSSLSNVRDKPPEIVIHEHEQETTKKDLLNSSIKSPLSSTSVTTTSHSLPDHNNTVFNNIQRDLNEVSKGSKIENGTIPTSHEIGNKQTVIASDMKSIDKLHTDTNSAQSTHTTNQIHTESFTNNHKTINDNDTFGMSKIKGSTVTISYAPSHESTEVDSVDEYLRSTSVEEREKTRKQVKITHALMKLDDDIDSYL